MGANQKMRNKMSYETEFNEKNAIGNIAKREFQGNEFKAGFKQGNFMFYGHTKVKDLKEHMEKAKEVFEKDY